MMKIRNLVVFIVLVCVTGILFAAKANTLPEVLKPFSIAVDNNQLYVVDNDIVRLFSLKDRKYVRDIGKKGQGPGEFTFSPQITAFPGYLFVNTWGKVIYFSRSGEYKDEKRLAFPIRYFVHPMLPVGQNFVGPHLLPGTAKISIKIFDKDFKPVKEIDNGVPQMIPLPPRPGEKKMDWEQVGHCWCYVVYKDKIYLGDSKKGFHFSIFDANGKKLSEIDLKHEKKKVTADFKEAIMKNHQSGPGWERNKNYYNYTFSEYYPAFADFKVDNEKIYAYTYETNKDKKYEIVVIDFKGKVLKRSFIGKLRPNTTRFKGWISISNDTLYHLEEDDETNEWTLQALEIK
jgi:hypothetical protein